MSPVELVSAVAPLDVEAPEEPLAPVVVSEEDAPLAPVVVAAGALVPEVVVALDVVAALVVVALVVVLLDAPVLDVSVVELPTGDTPASFPVSSLHDAAHKPTANAVTTVEPLTALGNARKRMDST